MAVAPGRWGVSTFCTAGLIGRFATANAVEFGECPGCGDGANDGDEGDEEADAPLFRSGSKLLCGWCCLEADEEPGAQVAVFEEQLEDEAHEERKGAC